MTYEHPDQHRSVSLSELGVDAWSADLAQVAARASVRVEPGVRRHQRLPLAGELGGHALAMPHWPEMIAAGLQSDDRHTGWLANAAAARYGIETFGLHWERLQADPLDGPWFDAWNSANSPARRDSLVDLARASFPPASIATGRADTLGFGPEFRAHRALDWTLQALRDHPGLGAGLVTLGLLSPMTRNRNMALAALKEWPVADWPEGIQADLRRIASSDPNERTRILAHEVLALTSSS